MKIAVCPGSFDPITLGHLDVIGRAAAIFDRVLVCVMTNGEKDRGMFPPQRRLELARLAVGDLPNVEAELWQGLLADYAAKIGACTIVKGLRAVSDFEYEFQMALTNAKLCPTAETMFMTTGIEYMYLSSSMVRQVASFGGDISAFVCPELVEDIKNRLGPKKAKE